MSEFRAFIHRYPVRQCRKGETILLKDDVPPAMFVVESGLVKVYTITNSGDERLIILVREEENFPIGYSLGLIDRAQYFYEAASNCRLRMIPPDDYLRYVLSSQQAMRHQLVRLTMLLLSTQARINALEQPRASDKIAETLLYLAGQFGTALRAPTAQLRIRMTQQEIANTLGLSRETTNIELKKLELKKLITHSRQSYVLYMEKLKQYLGKDRE